ncbi:MAG: GxxExxY protein [Planctomycetota bacterium]|nr:GxxExxY protein [Planctomycetota bacterium]
MALVKYSVYLFALRLCYLGVMMDISEDSELTGAVIGAAIAIHRQLGPGLREVAYEEALSIRLSRLGVANRRQVSMPLVYKNALLDCGYRLDILVEERLPLELKAVSQLQGIHDAQLSAYGCRQ